MRRMFWGVCFGPHTHLSQKLWPFEFTESFRVQFRASWYIMHLNRTSEWNVMTIRISLELSLFIFQHVNISWASHIHPSQKWWPFEFFESFPVQFRAVDILCVWIGDPIKMLWPFEFLKSLHCSFPSISLNHWPHKYTWVKSYGCLNLPRASFVHFLASWYMMGLTHTPESKVLRILPILTLVWHRHTCLWT